MRIKNFKSFFYILALSQILSCSGDKPTGPDNDIDNFGTVYFTNLISDSTFYSFDTKEMKLDSFYLPYKPEDIVYLRNNKKELVFSFTDSIISINLETKASTRFPDNFKNRFTYSKNEELIENSSTGISIYKSSDNSLVYQDTISSAGGCFSYDNNTYYSFYGKILSVIDINSQIITDSIIFNELISQIVTIDEDNIILIHTYGSYDKNEFHIYDLNIDSSVFVDTAGVERGLIEISPDSKYAFFTYGRSYIGLDNNQATSNETINTFNIYDIKARSLFKIVNTQGFVPGDYYPFEAYYDTEITADGKYLVGSQYFHNMLVVFDISTMTLHSYYKIGELPFAIYGLSG